MPRNVSASNSGSSSWIFALLTLVVLGSVFFWMTRPSAATFENPLPETVEQEQAPQSEPPTPTDLREIELQEIDLRKSEARQPVESDDAAPVALDTDSPLRGRVVPNYRLPTDEVLQVIVEVWTPPNEGEEGAESNRWIESFPHLRKWQELARLTPDVSGQFITPRPLDVKMVRLRVDGDYITGGEFEYEVGSEEEPDEREFELPAWVGAHITFQLALDDIATKEEIAALVGDTLRLSHPSPGMGGGYRPGSPNRPEAELDELGRATFRGLMTEEWSEGHERGNSEHQDLAPFRIAPGFSFRPFRGQRGVINVPVERGLPLRGFVTNTAGDPIEGAEVLVVLARRAVSFSGETWERRTSDATGQFLFQALSDTPLRLEISFGGFLPFKLGANDTAQLLGTKEPHTFRLKRGRTLKVRVTDARGLPAYGLPVHVHKGSSKKTLNNLRTNEEGQVQFFGLPSGPLSLSAKGRLRNELQKDPEERLRFLDYQNSLFGAIPRTDLDVEALWFAQATVPVDQQESGETFELEVRIAPIVRGTVTGIDPAWTDPVRLAILQPDPNMPASISRSMGSVHGEGTFAVDPDTGAFEGQLLPGHYSAIASSGRPSNGLLTTGALKVRTAPELEFDVGLDDLDLIIPFASASFIEGSVHLSDGTELAELTIRLSKHKDWFTQAVGVTTTDDLGHFRFEAEGQGLYHIRLDSPRYLLAQATQLEVQAGATPPIQRLTAVRAGALRVNFMAVDGSPLVEPIVQVFKADGANAHAQPIKNDPDWAGTFGPFAPASYTVEVPQEFPDGSTILHRMAFTIKPGQVTEVILHSLAEPLATITGTVTVHGDPVEGMAVWCSNEKGMVSMGPTDAKGRYTLSMPEVGSMSLECGPSPWTRILEQEIEVAPGINTMLPLSVPSGAMEGHFEGSPMMVFPAAFRAGAAEDEKAFRKCNNLSNGRFEISYLPDGLYELTGVGRDGKRSPDYKPQTVEIKGGSVVRDLKLAPLK